jgi:hypothetical protein
MKLGKNSSKWISLSVIAVLLLSFSFITVQSSLSIIHKLNSVILTSDFSYDKETSESEKDFNEDFSNLFFLEIENLKFQSSSKKIQKKQSAFLIPRVFYDIQILPPEVQLS